MSASEKSFVGLAKQNAEGTPVTDSTLFKYFLFSQGAIAPNNVFLPSDDEVGGGALMSSVEKVGVSSAGAFQLIPRPDTLGMFLAGALGSDSSALVQATTAAYKHTFTLPTDQFDAPFYTIRSAPGGPWGEQFQDVRLAALSLNWKAADYLRGMVAFQGGAPTPDVATQAEILAATPGGWDALNKVDRLAPFLAPKAAISFPAETDPNGIKVLSGSIAMGMNIPLDEQWITGSYFPDGFDITKRVFSVTLNLKVANKLLYDKMNYNPYWRGQLGSRCPEREHLLAALRKLAVRRGQHGLFSEALGERRCGQPERELVGDPDQPAGRPAGRDERDRILPGESQRCDRRADHGRAGQRHRERLRLISPEILYLNIFRRRKSFSASI